MRSVALLALLAGCLEADPRYCAAVEDCASSPYPYCDRVKHECESAPPDGFVLVDLHVEDSEAPFDAAMDAAPDAALDLREPADLTPQCTSATDCRMLTQPICDTVLQVCRPCMDRIDDSQCSAHADGNNVCDPVSQACVACNVNADCKTALAPICDGHSCRACQANKECPAIVVGGGWPTVGFCRGDGSCAAPSDAALVDNTVTCTALASPFCELADAITTSGKLLILVRGSGAMYQKAVTVASTVGALSILGPGPSASPTAQLSQNGQAAFTVATTGSATATVIIDGLDLIGSGGATKKDGVDCSQLGGATTLTLRNSLVHDSGAIGVSSSGCTLTLDANLIYNNGRGGIKIAGTTYTITNNIIPANGSSSDPLSGAGVSIDGTSTSTAFAFNTVSKNHIQTGIGGIDCGAGGTKPILSSVVWDNDTSTASQVGAQCTTTNVVTGTGTAAGAPVFTTDFHLKAGAAGNSACCADKVDAPGTPNADHDVDQAHRPQGATGKWTIGANELAL